MKTSCNNAVIHIFSDELSTQDAACDSSQEMRVEEDGAGDSLKMKPNRNIIVFNEKVKLITEEHDEESDKKVVQMVRM